MIIPMDILKKRIKCNKLKDYENTKKIEETD